MFIELEHGIIINSDQIVSICLHNNQKNLRMSNGDDYLTSSPNFDMWYGLRIPSDQKALVRSSENSGRRE